MSGMWRADADNQPLIPTLNYMNRRGGLRTDTASIFHFLSIITQFVRYMTVVSIYSIRSGGGMVGFLRFP